MAGTLWCGQFFFYGLGHVRVGNFQFISWVLHKSMLIFFSYGVGLLMKEWKQVSKPTYRILMFALLLLLASSVIISQGSYYGEQLMKKKCVDIFTSCDIRFADITPFGRDITKTGLIN